ncbi:MAG: transposase [Candidatus Margulisiibacteriota bacterium]
MEEIKVWGHNTEAVEEIILDGKENEVMMTAYGANEFAVDFLKRSGIWEHLLVKPKQGKENGKDWRKISGIAVLAELLHVGHLSRADKVIKDSKLMVELGFTFEEVERAKGEGKGVIHRDTIRNNFKSVPYEDSKEKFYEFVRFMREKKLIRGKVYAADGFEIEVTGTTYEGAGKVWDDKGKRWKYGYKAVLLMNVEEDRERMIGYAIGPINKDERELLKEILEDMEKHVGKAKEIMEVLVMDRGYWGYDFLEKTVVEKYGLDYVVIAKKTFNFVKEDLRHMIDSGQIKFEGRKLFNRSKKEWEEIKVGSAHGICHGYVSKDQPYQGKVNVVVMKKIENGKEKEVFYVTNKKITNALKIVKLYKSRWTIENQGIRDLSQRWLIRITAGRSRNAIEAGICLKLKLYNAMKIMEMKHGKEWDKNKEEIKAWGERSFMGGQGIIVYGGQYFGTFSARRYKELVEESTRRRILLRLKEKISKNPAGALTSDDLDGMIADITVKGFDF